MQQRYYDPAIGRFLSVDPMASDMQIGWNFNRYNYAANSPYTFVDPDGREIAFIGTSAERWLLHESLRKVEASNPASAARAQLLRDWPNLHTVRFPVSGEAPQNKTTGIMANDSNGVGTGSESIVDPTATTNTFNSDGTPAAISGEAALGHKPDARPERQDRRGHRRQQRPWPAHRHGAGGQGRPRRHGLPQP